MTRAETYSEDTVRPITTHGSIRIQSYSSCPHCAAQNPASLLPPVLNTILQGLRVAQAAVTERWP